jgi:PD-(D/E)XK nuclease superfamily
MGLIQHRTNPISEKVIGAAIEVHRHLGLIAEIKSVDKPLPIHSSQLMTYMRLQGVSSGLLMNFNVAILPHGIRRILL